MLLVTPRRHDSGEIYLGKGVLVRMWRTETRLEGGSEMRC